MAIPPVFNLKNWVEEHRHLLKPPVGNQQVYEDTDFIIMIVGGPNSRKDFHVNSTEEFFYQIQGDMNLVIMDEGKRRDVPIREGEIFLLPAGVPHSPQRGADTVGMVVERQRDVDDGLRWYCEQCGEVLYETQFQLKDIVNQLKVAIEAFFGNEELRTCKSCNAVMQPPS